MLKVTAEPKEQGTHSAVLTIDNNRTRGVEQSTLLTVEAATPLTADTTWSAGGSVNRNETVHYTVAVPAGTKSLTVNVSGLTDGSQTRWWAFTPEGLSGSRHGQPRLRREAGLSGGPARREVGDPGRGRLAPVGEGVAVSCPRAYRGQLLRRVVRVLSRSVRLVRL
ncbi:hypothetical protein ACFWVP_23300 [Streptomyces sp. NPDC058637]|uniref:hypothetical protein n=1 Tax=Streptomyces sp. NPDC058637 TaxID=3346569 RepID=UPI003666E176